MTMVLAILYSCADFLEPLPDGSYNGDNFSNYPKIIRGYVENAYNTLPSTYYTTEYIGSDAATDDAAYRPVTTSMHEFSIGAPNSADYPFASVWNRSYKGIWYTNMFLHDNVGYRTNYLVDPEANVVLKKCLQGDAFGLRAWFQYELLKVFGGWSSDGSHLGVPVLTEPIAMADIESETIVRPDFETCVEHIIADCDSALKYLPEANRDFMIQDEPLTVVGGIRYKRLDRVSVMGIKALTYLLWASPAHNPENDLTRYEKAADAAAYVLRHKLQNENVSGGFNPEKGFLWTEPNSPEAIWISDAASSTVFETNLYPVGFNGSARIVPTQDLVDAYPMANGYPISDSRSGYDSENPYEGRDPRFYADIFHNGSKALRITNPGDVMYTFDTFIGGKDAPGLTETSPTGYYVRKFIYLGWNKNDNSVQSAPHCIFFLRWAQMCLVFAEAANKVAGPLSSGTWGLTAKDALAWLRARPTSNGAAGVGAFSDPWLDECASSGKDSFDALVRNEWRLETCFEGQRFWHLRRWSAPGNDSLVNTDVHRAVITRSETGVLTYDLNETLYTRSYPSAYLPLPYNEVRKAPGMKQNKGWENWK